MTNIIRWTPERLDKLKELLNMRRSTDEIATYFGVSAFVVRQVMYRNEIKRGNVGQATTKLTAIKQTSENIDIASRIRVLLGIETRLEQPEAHFNDEQLMRWIGTAEGCARFAKEVWNIDLQDYQIEMIRNMLTHRRCVFVLGRQSGKDFSLSIFVVWKCITSPNERILLVSPAQRQSELLYNRILQLIGQSNELYDSVEKSNAEKCRFRNASEIYALPSTTYIRGFTEVTYAIINESCWGIPDEVFSAVEPMLAIRNGTLILVSSAGSRQGRTWEYFNNPLFCKMQLPSTVNAYLSKEWLELQKQTMPIQVYENEVLSQFSETADSFFSASTIQKCSQNYDFRHFKEEKLNYMLGVDWGRSRDSSVLTIVSCNPHNDTKKVEDMIELSNVPFSEQLERIKILHKTFSFFKIIAERSGLSLPLNEKLKEEGLQIIDFIPTLDNKVDAFNYLLRQMEEGKVIVPANHQKLQFQLRSFKYVITKDGKMKLHHASEAASDDFVDALCFAVYGFKNWYINYHSPVCFVKSNLGTTWY